MMLPSIPLVISSLWLGMLIGVSFIATPVKFRATSLSHATALDIGRVTFRFYARTEWLMAAGVLGTELVARTATLSLSLAYALIAIVLLQATWLLPVLNRRAVTIVGGGTVPTSHAHVLYGALECAKLVALVTLIVIALSI